MKLILHDLNADDFNKLSPNINSDVTIISDTSKIRKCIGCFNCWVKTPGKCILNDDYGNMGELLAKSDELIIISKCCYGSYSPFIKNVLDRCISYILPYFKVVNNELHHVPRYDKKFKLIVYSYGDSSPIEKDTFNALVQRNALNLNIDDYHVYFSTDLFTEDNLKEVLK